MSGTKTLDKAITILKLAIDSERPRNAKEIAEVISLPPATVYRHLAVFEKQGLVRRSPQGSLGPGADLIALVDRGLLHRLLATAARPILAEVSRKLKMISHIGVYENEMVTYLVKSEPEGQKVFTRENEQLEAYCSGIGKILLAELPGQELEAYLSTGPFPALTDSTVTDPEKLRQVLAITREEGFATDSGEIEPGLYCLAVPLRNLEGEAIAALSVSCRNVKTYEAEKDRMRKVLTDAAVKLRESLYGRWINKPSANGRD
jgi:IclR family acetate operon transcriptional repressor